MAEKRAGVAALHKDGASEADHEAILGRLEVEVKQNASYFKAFVVDVLGNEIVVEFENDSLARWKVPLSDGRLIDCDVDGEKLLEVEVGDEVEVCSRDRDAFFGAYGWRKAQVLQKKEKFYIVRYIDSKVQFNEIIGRERLRHPNRNPSLTVTQLCKCVIKLLENAGSVCTDVSLHRDLLKACQADCLIGNSKTSTVTLLSCTKETMKRAELLARLHFGNLSTKVRLRERQTRPCWEAKFTVPRKAMGLVIGAGGANIRACRQMPGITEIEVDSDYNMICIIGESDEAVCAARSQLEYCEETFHMAKDIAGKLIGKNRSNLKEIAEQTGVVSLNTAKDSASKGVDVKIFGLRDAVEEAIDELEEAVSLLSTKDTFREEFCIKDSVMGLAIGAHGANIQACRKMEGIMDVRLDSETNCFTIIGESAEAIQAARRQLEFCEKTFSVEKRLVGRIIGRNGTNMQSVVDESRIVRATMDDSGPDEIIFTLTGLCQAVEKACVLLEYNVLMCQELDLVGGSRRTRSQGNPQSAGADKKHARRVWHQQKASERDEVMRSTRERPKHTRRA